VIPFWRAAKRQKIYRRKNLKKVNAVVRRWKLAHPERVKELDRASAARPHVARKIKLTRKRYKTANRVRLSSENAAYYLKNKERIQARNNAWWHANPEFAIKFANQRRARIAQCPGREGSLERAKPSVQGAKVSLSDQRPERAG
jgi:hypothetical protein